MMDAVAIIGIAGLVITIAAQIWLIILILRGNPILAAVALIVPCFTYYFAVNNWDIAKWPVLCHVLGVLVLLTAMCLVG